MYELGASVRQDYEEYFGKGLLGSEVFVNSDGSNTCTGSASSFLSAIVSNKQLPSINLNNTDTRLYPFTNDSNYVHSLSENIDFNKSLPFNVDVIHVVAPDKADPRFKLDLQEVCPKLKGIHIGAKYANLAKFAKLIEPELEKTYHLYKTQGLIPRANRFRTNETDPDINVLNTYYLVELLYSKYLSIPSFADMTKEAREYVQLMWYFMDYV